jgi:hypothetical protein
MNNLINNQKYQYSGAGVKLILVLLVLFMNGVEISQ